MKSDCIFTFSNIICALKCFCQKKVDCEQMLHL